MAYKKISWFLLSTLCILVVLTILYNCYFDKPFYYKKIIHENTCNSISIHINNYNDDDTQLFPIILIDESHVLTSNLGEILSNIPIKSTSSLKKYVYHGDISFTDKNNNIFQINCFANNIIKINKNYYLTESNLLDIAINFYKTVNKQGIIKREK